MVCGRRVRQRTQARPPDGWDFLFCVYILYRRGVSQGGRARHWPGVCADGNRLSGNQACLTETTASADWRGRGGRAVWATAHKSIPVHNARAAGGEDASTLPTHARAAAHTDTAPSSSPHDGRFENHRRLTPELASAM